MPITTKLVVCGALVTESRNGFLKGVVVVVEAIKLPGAMRYQKLATAACLGVSISGLHALEFGNLEITQNNNSNNNQSTANPATTVVIGPGSTTGPNALQVVGYNRGDTDIDFGGGAQDVEEGMLITSVSENSRNNHGGGDLVSGLNFANTGLAFFSGVSEGFFVPTHNMGGSAENLLGRSEYNINFAYGYFPYDVFLAAHANVSSNGGPLAEVRGTAGVDLGEEILDNGNGVFTVDLSGHTRLGLPATPANGILLTVHGKNEGNFSMARDNGEGAFQVSVMDNGEFGGDLSYEQDPFGFVYLPAAVAGPDLITAVGRVKSDGTPAVSGGAFTVTPRRSVTSLGNVLVTGVFEAELTDNEATFTSQLPDPGANGYLLEIVSGPDAGSFCEITGVLSDTELGVAVPLSAEAADYADAGNPIEYRIGVRGYEYLLTIPGKNAGNGALLVTPEGGHAQATESDVITGAQFESEGVDTEGTFLSSLSGLGTTTYLLEILSGPDAGTVTEITGATSDTELSVAATLTALAGDYPVDYRVYTSVLPNNTDNFVSYQWSETDGGWVIQSRDVPDGFLTEQGSTPGQDMFSFAFLTTEPANSQPTVTLTSPADGGQVLLGSSLTLTADASDEAPGSVASVEFFMNGNSVGVDTSAPYEMPVGPFDSLDSYVVDAVVTDNDGARIDAASVTFSVVPTLGSGGGLYFNGLDQYVTFGDEPTFKLSTFTLETWFKPEGNFGAAAGTGSGGVSAVPLITKGRGESDQSEVDLNYFLGIRESDGVLVADFEDSILGQNVPIIGATPVTASEWQHAAVTFDGTEWRLYLNGNLEAVLDAGGLVPRADSIQHAALGSALDSTGEPAGFFQGFLDEARIWSVARSQEQIRQSCNFEIASDTGLVGRWAMTENAGSTVTSTADNSVGGTLLNNPVWSDGKVFTNNEKPNVTLDEPLDGERVTLGETITLAATAGDTDGSVTQVEFFEDGVSIGIDTAAPYEATTTASSPGAKVYTAVVTDDAGGTSRSFFTVINVTVAAPAIPGYSVGVIDGGSLDRDTPGYEAPGNGEFTYDIEQTTASPLGFDTPNDNRGDFDVYINGARVPLASGIMLFNNHPTPDNLASLDNNLSAAFNAEELYSISIEDNEGPGASNPGTPEESGRFSLGFFPFANGWYGANVDPAGAVLAGSANFPPGSSVTVTNTDTGTYEIGGLPTIGNLIAFSVGNGVDNVTSVGLNGTRWVVQSRDNGGGLQDEDFGFLFVPVETPQVFSGLVRNDGTLVPLNDEMERVGGLVNLGSQGYEITIGDGSVINPSNSVLFMVGDVDNGNGGDNIYSYFASGNTFVVFSQDLPGLSNAFQQGGFRFVVVPTDPVVLNGDEVEVFASDTSASEDGDTGLFTFVRRGDTSAELSVPIGVGGSASPVLDYTMLPSSVTFPAGSATTTLTVEAIADGFLEQDERVVVTLLGGSGYSLGVFASAVVEIESIAPSVDTVTLSFQEGVEGYTGQFGMRVGEEFVDQEGTRLKELGSEVEHYYLDGRPGSGSPDTNGIVRFDNIFGDGPGQIPPGAGIQDAQLVITTSTVGNAQSGGPYIVDQLTVPVDENTSYDDLQFGELGDGFEGVRGSVTGFPVAGFGAIDNGEVVMANVTQLVQNWSTALVDPFFDLPNHGFAIFTGGTTDGWSYNTVGNPNPQLRPKLVVTYTTEGTLRDYFFTADLNTIINNQQGGDNQAPATLDASLIATQFLDLNDENAGTTEALLRFPITFGDPEDINTIPDGETIIKAELLISTNSPRIGGSSNAQSGGPYAIHQMLVDWNTTSTFGLTGPVVPTDIDEAAARVEGMGWESATFGDITSVVQNWRAGDPNYGVNLKPETADGWQPLWLGVARDTGLSDLQPLLRVTTAILEPTMFDLYVESAGAPGENLAGDRDLDGIQAVIEYALGLDPTQFNLLPGMVPSGGDYVLSFSKGAEAASDPRVRFAIECSDDLVVWEDLPATEDASSISATLPGPDSGAGRVRKFGRLRIDYQQ